MSKRNKMWAFVAALVTSSLFHSCGGANWQWLLPILQEDLFG